MSVVDRLISHPPFAHDSISDELFRCAMEESFVHHMNGCPLFRSVVASAGFENSGDLKRRALHEWPHIFVGVFKQRDMLTGPRDAVVLELTSSGTGGRLSRNFIDDLSLQRVKTIARNVYDGLGLVAPDELVSYLCFSYDPAVANDVGTAFTDELLTSFTSLDEVFYAIRWYEGEGFRFDLEETLLRLDSWARQGKTVRLVGFPAFIHHIITVRRERRLPNLNLGALSFALTGGGWKTHAGREIPRHQFAGQCEEMLGIPAGNVRDLFGMVEHGVPYVQCEKGSFHVPVYGRVFVRDPLTLEVLEEGQVGLLQLMTPYWSSFPAPSVLTSDLAVLRPPCQCGRLGPTVEIIGRGGTRKHKGCAIQANELLGDR